MFIYPKNEDKTDTLSQREPKGKSEGTPREVRRKIGGGRPRINFTHMLNFNVAKVNLSLNLILG
jgi:hypothetical protein